MSMKVIKKNGQAVDFNPNKILNRIKKAATGLNVNCDEIFLKVTQGIYDNITTTELDDLVAETAAAYITTHYDYSKLASSILISRFHKETYPSFERLTKELYKHKIVSEQYYDFVIENADAIEAAIDYNNDYSFDFFSWGRLKSVYLLQNKFGKTIERPQQMYMRVAVQLGYNIKEVLEIYQSLAQKKYSPATPIMINASTKAGQLASCELHYLKGDDTSLILDTLSNICKSSAKAAGIGLAIHNLRSRHGKLSSGGKPAGVLKLAKIINEGMRFWDQGGKRPGSTAIYLEPWHADIEDFLEMRLPTGADTLRAMDMFQALWINDLFMQRVQNKEDWYLFCPNELAKNNIFLNQVYDDGVNNQFTKLYNKAVDLKLYTKVIPAEELWRKIYQALIETGMPYMTYKDAANKKTNHQNLGVIQSSNLCSEIIEYTDPDTTAICTLSSFPVQNFYVDGKFQWKEYQKVITRAVTALNKVIDENKYTNPEGEKGGKEQRALGLGIQGLADLFHKMKISFTSPEAFETNKKIYEALYYYALRASCDISKREFIKYCKKNDLDVEATSISDLDKDIQHRITYQGFKGSPFSKGILQYDMWGKTDEVESKSEFKWAELKADIIKYGVRNSLLTTQMPTATSASILGSSESFEPHTTNLSKRKVKERQYIIINRYMQEELQEMGWWSDWLKDQIIIEDGSVQSITALPKEFRERYRTVWEISQKDLVQMSVDRGMFIDQSQSLNIFMKEPTLSKVSSCLFYGWRNGLKTGSYYTHTRAISTGAKHLAVDVTSNNQTELRTGNGFVECENCSS